MLPVPLWEGLPSVVPATAPGLGDVSLQPWQAVLFRSTVQLLRKASAKPYLTGYAESSSTTAIVSIARAKLQHRETLTVNIHQHPSSTFFCYQHSTTSTPHGSSRCATTLHDRQDTPPSASPPEAALTGGLTARRDVPLSALPPEAYRTSLWRGHRSCSAQPPAFYYGISSSGGYARLLSSTVHLENTA